MKLFKNANIIGEDNIENGCLLVDGGEIKEVCRTAPKGDFEEVDLQGAYICPGFVDAHSHIGMFGDGVSYSESDCNEKSEIITPHIRAIDGVDIMDNCFREAAGEGVTTVVVGPGSANPIAGTFTAIKTSGKRIDDAAIKEEAAMKFAFGENPKKSHGDSLKTRMGVAAKIRQALFEAQNGDDFKALSLKKVLSGEMIVKAHAHRADDIFTALRIAKEFSLKISIDHCTEGHLIADKLKGENAVFCVGPILGDRGKSELRNKSFETMLAFEREGIDFAIICDHPEVPQKDLRLCALLAARAGLKKETALRAITINAAKYCGIDHRVGSLEAGKDADFVIFDKHPMDFESKVLNVYINGKKVK